MRKIDFAIAALVISAFVLSMNAYANEEKDESSNHKRHRAETHSPEAYGSNQGLYGARRDGAQRKPSGRVITITDAAFDFSE